MQNLKQEDILTPNEILETETNLELLNDIPEIGSNNETFENLYGDSVPPYMKSFEPLFTLKEQHVLL